MSIVFVGDGPCGSGKGGPLSVAEHDGNNYNHSQRLDALEGAPAVTLAVSYSGGSITFLVNGGAGAGGYDLGPFALPVASLNFVGPWTNATPLLAGNMVSVDGDGIYLVRVDHTTPAAPATFDPDATTDDTDAELLYALLIPFADLSLVLTWRGTYAAARDYTINNMFVEPNFGLFVVLQDHTSDDPFNPNAENDDGPLYRQIAGPPFSPVVTVTASTYTLALTDVGKYLRFTNAAGCEITFPADVEFASGIEIEMRQAAAGALMFVAGGTDVTINPQCQDCPTDSPYQGAVIRAKYLGDNEWDLSGPAAGMDGTF